jgi:putative endonuclease
MYQTTNVLPYGTTARPRSLGVPKNRRKIGDLGESIARAHLERAGFSIVAANWTARSAEIDLIARDRCGTLWFFEVKFRRSGGSHGTAAEAFTPKKRHDFFRAVGLYCMKNGIDLDSVRTSLIAIDETMRGYRLTQYSNLSPEL